MAIDQDFRVEGLVVVGAGHGHAVCARGEDGPVVAALDLGHMNSAARKSPEGIGQCVCVDTLRVEATRGEAEMVHGVEEDYYRRFSVPWSHA